MNTEIKFEIDKTDFPELNYSNNELNVIAKQLFVTWYNDNHKQIITANNLDKKITAGLEPIINNLFNVSTCTVKKGKALEQTIETIIKDTFKSYSYVSTAHIPHSGDGMLTSPTGFKCIVEMKNYDNTVPTTQIIKLKNDMIVNDINNGLMISTNKIQGKKPFDIETFASNKNIIYVSNYFDYDGILEMAMVVLEHINSGNKIDIRTRIETLNETINSITKLKTNFLAMEKSIRGSLESYYYGLRDYENDVKMQIENIITRISKVDKMIYSYNNTVLDRIYYNILQLYDLQYTNDNNIICVYLKKYKIFEFKIGRKLVVNVPDYDLKLDITNNNLFMIESFLHTIIEHNMIK